MASVTSADVQTKVPTVREKFLSKFSGSILDDTYDSADVKWVKSSDPFIRNVLKANKTSGDVDKSVNLIDEVLKFRAKYKLSSLKESELNQDLLKLNAVFFQGLDKKGNTIFHFRVSSVKKGQYPVDDIKRVIAYRMNEYYMAHMEEQVVCLFDFTNAGISNFDTDVSKFIITSNEIYFPELVAYGILFKMGKPLEVIWAVVKTFMSAHQVENTHVLSRKNIQTYIAEDQLLPHMLKEEKK